MTSSAFVSGNDPYAMLPALYDLEHDQFEDDLPIILHFAAVSDLPVLEAGSGTGRVLRALAQNGIQATGIDLSRPMNDAARVRLAATQNGNTTTIIEGDMRELDATGTEQFGLVVYGLNALMHLVTVEDQLASLRSAWNALAPGGAVLIDLMHPHPEQLTHLGSGPLLEGSWQTDDDSIVDKWSARVIRPATQVIETTLWYDMFKPDGSFQRIRTAFDHRYVHASELMFMLGACGFSEVSLFGGYDMEPFHDDAERIIAHAVKPESDSR